MIQPNPHLLKIHRSSEADPERRRYTGLDRNERVTPLPPGEFRAILQAVHPETLCHYPDPTMFYQQLSRSLRLPVASLYATPGSDAVFRMAFQAFVRRGNTVVFPSPSYMMYGIYSQLAQAKVVTLPYGEDLQLDVQRLLTLLKRRPRLLLLANPDQPTGSVLEPRSLRKILQTARTHGTLVIIDEAYHPFYLHSVIREVQHFDNLIVARSFSKSGGLAGLRLGYFAANPRLVNLLSRVRGAFEVNAIAFAFGTYLLKHPKIVRDHVRNVEQGRTLLLKFADTCGIGHPSCPTNFQLLRFAGMDKTDALVALLKKKGFLVKGSFAAPALRHCIRVTLDGPNVMRPLTAALKASLRKLQWTSR